MAVGSKQSAKAMFGISNEQWLRQKKRCSKSDQANIINPATPNPDSRSKKMQAWS
jgi:hypothetical protein